ncbi:MAG: HIG1 domain-containing protein [Gammaproteobacteria bacterium]|nr:HIG1 domain-containing protein [Gammaproteobacteria bacterium]
MDPLAIVITLALAATSIALLLGLMSMGSPSTNRVASTPLMWARVGFQGFTLVLLIVAFLLQN